MAARAMDFPVFNDMTECTARAEQLQGLVPLSEMNTFTETYLVGMRSDPRLINDMRRQNWNQQQKASRAALWISEHLVLAAPRILGLWLLNKKVIAAAKIEIMRGEYDAINNAAIARFGVETTTAADLELYKVASKRFRTRMNDHLPYNAFKDIHDNVEQRMMVSRSVLGAMNDMLTSIVMKRNARLGNNGEGPGPRGNGVQHYDMYVDYIMDPEEDAALMNLHKRTTGNKGTLMAAGELNEAAADATQKHGYLLLSTALKHHMTLHNLTAADFAHDARPMMIHALAEVATMTNDNNALVRSDYSQQCANIDIIFNFYLTCRATQIFEGATPMTANEWKKMKKLNQGLFAIGQRLNSKQKVTEIITAAGGPLRSLMNRVNITGSPHMPPYACTYRRIYDFVAVFGMMKYNELERTFFSCGISPRYFVHFKPASEVAMTIITYYWRCIEAMNETDHEVKNEAEHYFHQILINKISGYVNTTGKDGNVFNVTLHQRVGPDVPRVIQQTVAEIAAAARPAQQPAAEDGEDNNNA